MPVKVAVDGVVWIAGVAMVVVAAGLLALFVPWGNADHDLDSDTQARLLLGEDPAVIDAELRHRFEEAWSDATPASDEEAR